MIRGTGGGEGVGPTIAPHSTWRPHRDVVAQRLGNTGVLIDLRSGGIFELNATGLRIWELLADGTSRLDILRRLEAEFGAPSSEIEPDVDDLLRRLAEARLLEP